MHSHDKTEKFILTLFGASGDLAKIKIFPSLYLLAKNNYLPNDYLIVGYARTELSRKQFQSIVRKSIKKHVKGYIDIKVLNDLLKHIDYYQGQYSEKESFVDYRKYLSKKRIELGGTGLKVKTPHIAYFSVPPVVFRDIAINLSNTRKSRNEDIRLVIEKPFGEDQKTAEALFHLVSNHYREDQFYLLDHYLGKNSVQSILHMRQANRILNNIIRGSQISNVQITAMESVGVENRIGYFEQVGIVKDVIQSHLLQVLALVTMNIPNAHQASSLQREKTHVLDSIDPACNPDDIVIGQYQSYKEKKDVPHKSRTETFAALRLFLDNQEWYKVPLYIRTGKKLNKKHTYAVIELKKFPFQGEDEAPNRVVIEFYPIPKISIFMINPQDRTKTYQEVSTSASIACESDGCLPEHADLILDVINKDKMHFLSFSEIIASWKVIDVIEKHIKKRKVKLHIYKDRTSGPEQQNKLPKRDGFEWYDPFEKKNK